MYRIFLVEDDRGIADAIAAQTALWDMETVCVKDFHTVMAEFFTCVPQLVLLDISLPFYGGCIDAERSETSPKYRSFSSPPLPIT